MVSEEFVKKYWKYAKEAESRNGISALFILAQAAQETGWGKSIPGNMFFGIKAKPDDVNRQLLKTHEIHKTKKHKYPEIISITPYGSNYKYIVRDWFRKYDSPADSFADLSLLYQKDRYKEAMTYRHDPYKFAEMIHAAGYASDPQYSANIKKIISKIESYLTISDVESKD
jgi:flagellar protein FlgJ